MKNFKRASALLLTIALVLGMLPAMVFATEGSTPAPVAPATDPVAGDKVLFADFGASKDAAWQDTYGAKLSDGSKIVATWDATYLYLVYATKEGAAVTVNGKAATVTAGDTYDIAKIGLAQLGITPKNYKSYYRLALTVADATWEGFVYLRDDTPMLVKTGYADKITTGKVNYTHNWVATDTALGSSYRVNYQAFQASGSSLFYSGSANGYVVDLDLDLTTLPVVSMDDETLANTLYRPLTTGITFAMYDLFTNGSSVDAEGNALELAVNRDQVFFNIVKNDTGLKLLSRNNDNSNYLVTDLDDDLGTQIHVRAEAYYTGGVMQRGITLKVYINDKFVLQTPHARMTNGCLGTTPSNNTLGIMVMVNNFDTIADQNHEKNNIQAADVTVSNVKYSEVNGAAYEAKAGIYDSVLIAPRGGNAVTAFNGGAFNGMSVLLSDGASKVFAAWDDQRLTLVYPTQNGAVATINGKAMTVIAGATYDMAMIPLSALNIKTSCVEFLASFAVNGKTWEGFIYLDELTAAAKNINTGNGGWSTVYTYNQAAGTAYDHNEEMASTANEFALDDIVVYDMNLSITSLPTQAPSALGKPKNGGYCGQGLTVVMGDPYTQNASTNLPAATTSQQWTPLVVAKDASGKLYIAIWEFGAWKYAYVDGIVLDDTTAYNLDVRAEFSHVSATSNVTTLKVYVNGELFLTSANARYTTTLGTSNAGNSHTIKRCAYTASEALKLTFEAKQYVRTPSEVADNDALIAPLNADAVAAFEGGVWTGMSALLSDGTSKLFASWGAGKLTLVYPTQNGAAATINGKAMTVRARDTYDVAVISLEDLDLDIQTSCVEFLASFAVNGKTWDGFIYLDELTDGKNNTASAWTKTYTWDATSVSSDNWLNGIANDFDLSKNPTIVYDMNLSITSLPTLNPANVAAVAYGGGKFGQGLTVVMGDPYTKIGSTNLPAAVTSQQWSPLFFGKDASGNLYIAIWENGAVKYEYVDGIVLDDTTAHNLDVRAEFCHASATSNVTVLKVYVNGVLLLTSDNARCTTSLGTAPNPDIYGLKACAHTVDEALKLTFEVKQYVKTPSEVLDSNFIFAVKGEDADAVWVGAQGQLAAGEKFGIGWYGTCLHIIYAKQGVDEFKVNGKDATVVNGDIYDIAVISYEDLGISAIAANVPYALNLEVNGKTWDGFVVLNDLGESAILAGSVSSRGGITKIDEPSIDYGPWLHGTQGAIEIAANKPVIMNWDVNVKQLPTSCEPDEITSWRGGWRSGYDYSWVKGITFVLYDPFTADANAGVQKRWIPVSLIKDACGDLYVIYCENNQFKNVWLQGVTLDAENGTDLHFRVELTYADAANHTVALKCYVNDTFLFESSNARNTTINVGSTPQANGFGMTLKGNNYDVASNDSNNADAWASGKVADAIEAGATVLENIEAIDFAMANFAIQTQNAELELPEDIEAHIHKYVGAVTKEPTCVSGVMTYTCECGKSYTEAIPADGEHNFVYEWDETYHWLECENCDLEKDGVRYEHTVTDSNCEDGLFCDDCGYEILTAGDHEFGEFEVITEATCTTDGLKRAKCTRCDTWKDEIIPATGHSYGEGVVTTEPTCGKDGVMTYTCACGDTYTEVIPATGHDYVDGICGNCGEAEPVVEITDGLVFKNDTYYYLVNGVAQTGAVNVTNVNGLDFATGWYRFDGPDGAISNGKFNINGIDRIYVNGVQFKDGMVAVTNAEGKTEIYFLNVNGIIQKGAQQVVNAIEGFTENGWYMFHPTTGVLCHGVVEIDGFNFMYLNGVKQKRTMVDLDGKIYATNVHGVICQNGAIEVVKPVGDYVAGWYRFDEEGVICNGMFEIDGFTYYYKDGVKVKDTMFVYTDGKIYGTNRNGVVVSAAYELKYAMDDERLSFFEPGWYKFNSDGTLAEGFQVINGQDFYYRNGRKIMWQMFEADGKYFYARRDGVICKNGAFEVVNPLEGFEAGYYMLDADGSFFNGVHANGKTYVNGRAV